MLDYENGMGIKMQKRYNYVVHIIVEATCISPIRVGNSENNMETVLKDKQGIPFIPGTSLAGIFREFLGKENYVDALLGNQNQEGSLVISDGIFQQYNEILRPRIRMNPKTGTGVQGAKFDIAHLEKGAKFVFSLTWAGLKDSKGDTEVIYNMLSSLHSGNIQLGSQKTNGFGRVSIQAKQQIYDLEKATDRKHWLNGTGQYIPILLQKVIDKKYVVFKIIGEAQNILIKGETKDTYNGNNTDKSVKYVVNMQENGEAIVPASSVKGVIRTRMIEIANLLHLDIETKIFGGKDKSGTVIFEDIILKNNRERIIPRIHVNSFTGGVIDGSLFSEAPIWSDITFSIKVEQEDITCALLLFALRDLATGMFAIGSGKTIGRGQIDVKEIEVITPNNQKAIIKVDGKKKIILEDSHKFVENCVKRLEEEHDNRKSEC
ncbi:MAG: RAMP superfamily CRISPR-associated protein [Eubacteriales bacterium]